jgi:probable rRNA maturation factor
MSELALRNRQHTRPIDLSRLRRIARTLLTDLIGVTDYEFGVHLVAAPEMTRLNKRFLDHEGSTDVITFDYGRDTRGIRRVTPRLSGELFICVDDAVRQARRFRTTWQSELSRYLVHGVLHLLGHDDLHGRRRRVMKREEARLLRALERRFPLRRDSRILPDNRARTAIHGSHGRSSRRGFALSIRARKPRVRP